MNSVILCREDTALMWAQARSLGFCLVAAGQDIQAFYRTSREETLAIFGSSNLKILGKLEDPLCIFQIFYLPVSFEKQQFFEYTYETVTLTEEEAISSHG